MLVWFNQKLFTCSVSRVCGCKFYFSRTLCPDLESVIIGLILSLDRWSRIFYPLSKKKVRQRASPWNFFSHLRTQRSNEQKNLNSGIKKNPDRNACGHWLVRLTRVVPTFTMAATRPRSAFPPRQLAYRYSRFIRLSQSFCCSASSGCSLPGQFSCPHCSSHEFCKALC